MSASVCCKKYLMIGLGCALLASNLLWLGDLLLRREPDPVWATLLKFIFGVAVGSCFIVFARLDPKKHSGLRRRVASAPLRSAVVVLLALSTIPQSFHYHLRWSRSPTRWILPNDYVGSVEALFNVPGAPPTPYEDGYWIIEVSPEGKFYSSMSFDSGSTNLPSEYLYRQSDDLLVPIHRRGKEIVGPNSGSKGSNGFITFFVGSGADYQDHMRRRREERITNGASGGKTAGIN